MKHPESENPYIQRAQTLLRLCESEPANEAEYLWKVQVFAALAQAVELESIGNQLYNLDHTLGDVEERLERIESNIQDIFEKLYS